MGKKPLILLVDDSKETLEGLEGFLENKFGVITASDGLDAIQKFDDPGRKFDLVITDLVMPMISGVGLISLLKERSPQTPIIAMTGWGKFPSELAAQAKADKILMKPFDLEDFDRSVSWALEKRR